MVLFGLYELLIDHCVIVTCMDLFCLSHFFASNLLLTKYEGTFSLKCNKNIYLLLFICLLFIYLQTSLNGTLQ